MPQIIRVGTFEVNLDVELGKGGFGTVYRAIDMSQTPPQECAAKRVDFCAACPRATVENEVATLRAVANHSSIIALLGYEGGDDGAWIFMEMASGGELFDRLIDSGNLSERAARPYATALIAALCHCHSRGVVHRDVKLENVLLCAEDPHAVKLADFGLAVRLPLLPDGSLEARRLYDGVGSKSYKAPELFSAAAGYAAPPVDVWATGITLFSLLSGFFPFDRANPRDWRFAQFAEATATGGSACDALFAQYSRTCNFSAAAKHMLDSMLSIDPAGRPTLAALLQHPWVNQGDEEMSYAGGDSVVYRSLTGGDDGPVEYAVPPDALRVSRQRAAIGDDEDS